MAQILPEYIRERDNFRQALLAQEGGILKYWAEHPDADGLTTLYKDHRDQCAYNYREEHKWEIISGDVIKREALAEDHIKKELVYMEALKPVLSISFAEVAEQTIKFIEDYLDYAFKEWRRSLYPNGIAPRELYNEVIGAYRWSEWDILKGVAAKCLKLVLEEHRGTSEARKDKDDLWMEFLIQKYAKVYFIRFKELRQAVKEIINNSTQNKTEEESRRICRKMAMETMKSLSLSGFAHRVNGDYDLVKILRGYIDDELPDGKVKRVPLYEIWSTEYVEAAGYDVNKNKKKEIIITKEEMAWLRGEMYHVDSSRITNYNKGMTLKKWFDHYYHVLKEIGQIWAAQLLIHGIDMRELEKETGTILNKDSSPLYYVDRGTDNHRGDCCVYDVKEAKELLNKIKHEDDDVATKLKAILEYVGRLKDVVKEEYVTVYIQMWQEILKKESVKSEVYEKGKQKDTIFNRNLVAKIIKLMNDNGIFKVGTNPTNMARLLDPKRGENSPIREQLGLTLTNKSVKKNVDDVIVEFQNKTKANK